jgi:molybdopterin-binding protein
MNKLKAKITHIKESGSLSIVWLKVNDILLNAIIIDNKSTTSYLKIDREIDLLFKETELILSKTKPENLSISNCIPGVVQNISYGTLLSKVTLSSNAGSLVAILPSHSLEPLALKKGNQVYALIKTNEILLSN